jgi:transposase
MDSPRVFRHKGAHEENRRLINKGIVMNGIRCGLDIAKRVFQVHWVDARGEVTLRKTLKRAQVLQHFANVPPGIVGIEACAGAHYWGRELTRLGHTVKLMAAQFVSPYRKSGKNDANDAEAICEAVHRPNMRFVAIKSEEQQSVLMWHRVRTLAVANRTALVNQMRGLLGEFGLIAPAGIAQLRRRIPGILEDADAKLPSLARQILNDLLEQLHGLDDRIETYERQLATLARETDAARRIMAIEGVGPITATAFVAAVGDARVFRSGRQFAAWLGLTPKQHSSGGRSCLSGITKRGDAYLRTLLIHGARAVLYHVRRKSDVKSAWAARLLDRRHANVVAIALAAKQARVIWALLARGTEYHPSPAAAT